MFVSTLNQLSCKLISTCSCANLKSCFHRNCNECNQPIGQKDFNGATPRQKPPKKSASKKKIRRKKKFSGKEGKNHRRRLKLYRVGLMPKPENPKRALACPHSRLVRERGWESEWESAKPSVGGFGRRYDCGWERVREDGREREGGRERRREPQAGYRSWDITCGEVVLLFVAFWSPFVDHFSRT